MAPGASILTSSFCLHIIPVVTISYPFNRLSLPTSLSYNMIFATKLVVPLLAISGVDAFKPIKPRSAASNVTLYAYGANITGLSIFYADSMNNNSIHPFLSLNYCVFISKY